MPLLSNPHVQTVLGNLLSWPRDHYPSRLGTVALPDGDALAIHDTVPPPWQVGQPVAVLVHGLGGSHRSGYMRRIANRLALAGLRVVRVDLRGAGAGLTLAKRFYNAACSADVRAVLAQLHAATPASALVLFGFSLGGNIVLKLAGEDGARPHPALKAVVAVAPPIDLVRCSALLERLPWYDRFYVRQLIGQVQQHGKHVPGVEPIVFPAGTTLRQFDEIYTAPRWGFSGALDYYRRASALPWLPSIRVPTLILTARDDPLIAVAPFLETSLPTSVSLEIVRHGGHLGFLGGDGRGGIRWAETRIVAWALEQLERGPA
ncbi:MAG: alpha/beta fold hydrolase [Gemmataceae bacterium]|nr:alpha/beta fold hydrolase [Gemmataceae bacterium]